MSSHELDLASLLYQLALSFDGAVLGVALAYTAVRPLVILRGQVEPKSVVDGKNWKNLTHSGVLVSHESGDKAVIIQRTQTCIYNEWRGFFGWTPDIRSIFGRSWKKRESTSLRTVPFILVEGGWWPQSDYVIVDMDGSRQPLPLITVFHRLQPIDVSPYTFIQAIFGHECPVGVLDEEKILPLGKNISAIGSCSFKNGIPEIKSCKDLPYFLTELTKDQMVVDLAYRTKILFWSGIVLGSLSIGILSYAIVRNWNRWKECRQQRRSRQPSQAPSNDADSQVGADEEVAGDIPDGQLCVVCLMRRRTSAFNPCGHLVCCNRCAISVEREITPKCPICRMPIRNSMRIYLS
ncbi:Mitochondrial ubiquitin ligase activator of NFKB [Melia azedarach]|uniref:Mitochondrial ubiquitin ligase activator of NFKB n=1 Tax=Melia azedarach TaxID=155640 RepID=A0ACC1Y2E8_MELAZ|nr:Mitochondrial ubiquitin ligase activator of NFKB [Melia azedarach]